MVSGVKMASIGRERGVEFIVIYSAELLWSLFHINQPPNNY